MITQLPLLPVKRGFLAAVLCFLASAVLAQTAVAPSAGNGTASNPYRIASLENLYWLSQNPAEYADEKYFIQTADIDASATATWFDDGNGGYYGFPSIGGFSLGVGNQVGGVFEGHYDARGYAISNLYIRRSPHYVALFGYCNDATIKNLRLESPKVIVGSDGGSISDGYQGNALLMASGSVTIDNVHITAGTLTVNSWHGYIGGMLGRTQTVNATNCSVAAAIDITTTYGGSSGGFVGYSESSLSKFTNCSSSGSLTSGTLSYCGGFTGGTYAGAYTYSRCFSSMDVTVPMYGGGFSGMIYDGGSAFVNCYATGAVTSANGGGFNAYTNEGISSLTNCYATGKVNGSSAGGFAAMAGDHAYTNCFWDAEASGIADAFGMGLHTGVAGKTTAEMKTASTFTGAGWNFRNEITNGTSDDWFMASGYNQGYPAHVGDIREWTGATSSNWADASNWKAGILPTSTSIITLNPRAANLPSVSANITADRFTFNGIDHVLDLGNYNFNARQVLGFGANRYVKTSGNGVLTLTIDDTHLATFPVGNSSFNPADISNRSGSADDFSIKVLDEVHANGSSGLTLSDNRVKRTWDISKTNPNSGSGIDLTFYWSPGDVSSALTTPALYHYAGTWARQTGTTAYGATQLSYQGYNGTFSPFAVIEVNSTLAASTTGFTAVKQGKDVVLNWRTVSEEGTEKYTVQHSVSRNNWQTIDQKTSAGSSSGVQHYSFVHTQPVSGANFYRLVQKDEDGKVSYSMVVKVYFSGSEASVVLYPNPVTNGQLTIRMEKGTVIQVYNSAGAVVLQKALAAGTHSLPLNQLPKGVYQLTTGEVTKTFVLQ